jgi:cellulose synthase/poly-beta-1,6-N-acetylglucosamine synthase-like glycosyltransferase
MKWVFWLSLSLIIYTYLGYPLWLWLRRLWRTRPVVSAPILPSISVIMALHNEAEVLPRKLCNLLEIDYPTDRCEIVVVSDGSTDATNRILAAAAEERLQVLTLPQRQGKASALNCGIQAAKGEIVVFTDARQLIEPSAVRCLVANFADPEVGCVSGELLLGEPEAAPSVNGVGVYWDIEKKIRQCESASGSVIGATGALYAIRRELAVPLPPGTILDDVYLPLHVVRLGSRVIFEPRAKAFDDLAPGGREFRRKVRTLTGNYQLLQLAPWLLTRTNPVRFEFVCHKLLRLVVPFALASVLVSSLLLEGGFFRFASLLQLLFYGLATLATFRTPPGVLSRLANLSFAFVLLNTAAAVAFAYFMTGKKEVWAR